MTILLDNKLITVEGLSEDATVQQWIDAAKEHLDDPGAIIVGLRENGQDVLPERLEDLFPNPIRNYPGLEFVSGKPAQIAIEAIEETRGSLANTFIIVKQAGENLTAGKVEEAMAGLVECLKIWLRAHQAVVQSSSLLQLPLEEFKISDRPMIEWLGELVAMLQNIKEAIEARDNVLLSDILNYELDETLQNWEQMLGEFMQYIREQSPSKTSTPS